MGSDHRPNRVKRNASGAAQLRLDAIDALETHCGSPALISQWTWRTLPLTNSSTDSDSAMSFADTTKRLNPTHPTPCPATSTDAPPPSTDVASRSSRADDQKKLADVYSAPEPM